MEFNHRSLKTGVRRVTLLGVALGLLFSTTLPAFAETPKRTYPSSKLLFSGIIDPDGDRIEQSIKLAAENEMQWVSVDVAWSDIWTTEDTQIKTRKLNTLMASAEDANLQVLVSLTDTPDWAISSSGPNPFATRTLINHLLENYPAIQAIELFPAANTTAGWGAAPSPHNYLTLYRFIKLGLLEQERSIQLIAGGLVDITNITDKTALDDMTFMQGLYEAGAINYIDTFSIQLNGEELANLEAGPSRYEQVRFSMLQAEHRNAKLWITKYTWPANLKTENDKNVWLVEYYDKIEKHLYIENIFFLQLNPVSIFQSWLSNTLVGRNGKFIAGATELLEWLNSDQNYAQSVPLADIESSTNTP